jgi:aspartyl-tRNA synthetase
MELSFITPEDLYAIVERVVARVWHEHKGVTLPIPFRRMAYRQAIAKVRPPYYH